ncbi:ead/Ea22-like family protein [Enterobacter asburiae]|uniref:ead/Ea22-like family protein n=1 Tax=Enterobacter asburiae TaxID=61645 RepID=UPI002455471D|nr:ead/Ea22-like family protein [Enterobacter asburiae]MDH5022403.1 ead/Ea22-like family protein [Enterobacter asburiae]
MSNFDKQALRKRYSAKPTPICDICGAEMTIQRMSGSRVTYGCSGAIYDETGCHYAEGRSLADDHYEQSRLTVTDESDPDVLALLDELAFLDKRNAELNSRLERWAVDRAQSASELEAAEKRIADLKEAFRIALSAAGIDVPAAAGKGEAS